MSTGVSGDHRRNVAPRAEQETPTDAPGAAGLLARSIVGTRAASLAVLASAIALSLAALGCELLLGIEDIELGTPASACWDANGNGGRGCYRAGEPGCPVQSEHSAEVHNRIINACSPASCIPFTTELTKFGGSTNLPPLPPGGGAGGMGGMGGGGVGGAMEKCSEIIDPALPRIYMAGSNAVVQLLQKAAPILSGPDAEEPVVIIYQAMSSCEGFKRIAYDDPIFSTATYFVNPTMPGDSGERQCELDAGGSSVDIGTCDVFAGTCITSVLGNDFADYGSGPIQAMTLVAPLTSEQKVLSREAAYLIYGFGADSELAPFTDEARILQRNDDSGTKRMIAPAIDVPYDLWKGKVLKSTSIMKEELKAANAEGGSAANATVGILDVINDDNAKDYLKILAFQAEGQTCGFWPDSAPDKEDKKNVRDGHYVIWGPLHFFVKASNKTPINPLATDVVNYLTGFRPLPNEKFAFTMVGLQAEGSLIPRCAMRVDRTTELGELKPYTTDYPCGCFFDKVVTGEATGCKPCSSDAQCDSAVEVCSFDFCERR